MMRKIAICLAAVTIATAGPMLTASALPSGGASSVAQSVGDVDGIAKGGFGRGGFGRGAFGQPLPRWAIHHLTNRSRLGT